MNVTKASLERIDQHWAIQAIGNKEINRAVELSNRLLVEKAVGVQSEEGVLLRMNSVPRTIAESLGSVMKDSMSKENRTVQDARSFLKLSDITAWVKAVPQTSPLSGEAYKRIWKILSGEDR